jgi:hypothetical protein
MTKLRRGGYVFVTYISDHAPRHVHVYRDGELVLKWNLADQVPMEGKPTRKVVQLIKELEDENRL